MQPKKLASAQRMLRVLGGKRHSAGCAASKNDQPQRTSPSCELKETSQAHI